MTEIGSVTFEHPVVQAGMGGGLSQHELAAAVTGAGGLGTVGIMKPEAVKWELRQVRERTEGPVAANILMPLARRAHWEAAADADLVVTFWGQPRRMGSTPWVHQVGSVDEALAAQRAGADGVIVQGVEAGGHVRGTESALVLLQRARAALPPGYPVLSAGGIATADDVRERVDAGATAAVLGTRFLMTDESRAHTAYKQRLQEGWLTGDERGPAWVRALNRVTAPIAARTPDRLQARLLLRQSASIPLLSPQPVTRDFPTRLLDVTPLYAGESVARIHDIRRAADVVAELVP